MSLIDYVGKIKAEFLQIDRYFIGFLLVKKFYKSLLDRIEKIKGRINIYDLKKEWLFVEAVAWISEKSGHLRIIHLVA